MMKWLPQVHARSTQEGRSSVVMLQAGRQYKGVPLNRRLSTGLGIIIACRGREASTKISRVVACVMSNQKCQWMIHREMIRFRLVQISAKAN